MKRTKSPRRRGFSMVELLLSLAIVSMVLTSSMVALDAAFKGYRATTDTASTHVVSRIVMHRIVAMIRTGKEFGPSRATCSTPGRTRSSRTLSNS